MDSFDDIKSLFDEDKFDLPPQRTEDAAGKNHRLFKLEKTLDSYMGYWEEWKTSKGCFLNEREVQSIESFRKHGTHAVLANKLDLSTSRISSIYNKAIRSLNNNQHLFRHWIANKIFTHAGLHQQLDAKEEFLMRPLHEHQLSKGLYLLLSVETENLSELIHRYSATDLLKIRGMGKKKLQELKDLLEVNNCLPMLRQ